MAPSGNVISFEDAKRMASSSSARAAESVSGSASGSRPSVKAAKKASGSKAPSSRNSKAASSRGSKSATAKSSASRPAAKTERSERANRSAGAVKQAKAERSAVSEAPGRSVRSESRRAADAAKRPSWFDDFELPDNVESVVVDRSSGSAAPQDEVGESSAEDQRAARRRRKAKEKAGRQFLKQFGDSSDSSEAGTRPALYKAEMGKEHKRAFEQMGGVARSGAAAVAGAVSRKASEPTRTGVPRFVMWGGIAACLLSVCVYLYPAAQQYYVELRNHDRLQAEYDAVAARNGAIQGDVDYLGTDEGMEDAARSELGWVYEGEHPVIVAGLPETSQQESAGEKVRKQVVAGSVPAPDTWYSGVLDPFFGYEPGTQVKI